MRIFFLLCFYAFQSFGLADGKYEITSFSRTFYDDNVFMRAAGSHKTDTFYYSQSFGIKAKFFRDKWSLNATPEIRYRQVDNVTQFFGSAAIKGKQEFGPLVTLETSNKFAHSERDPSDIDDDLDVTYFSNKLNNTLTWQPRYLTKLKAGYNYSTKQWSDNLPISETESTNGDFTKEEYTFTLEQIIHKRFILEVVGKTSELEYNGDRGGLNTSTAYTQYSYIPNSFTILKLNYGMIWSDIENKSGIITKYTTPTYGANLTFFTPRGTVLGFNMVYEVMDSSIAYWNMKENLKTQIMFKYPITPKLEVSAMGAHLITNYKDFGNRYEGLNLTREEEVFVSSITLSWRYNRNHYAEIGYQGLHLFNDAADVFKNKVFLGYKVTF